MFVIKYEHHLMPNPRLPYIFHTDSCFYRESGITNWHENTEFLYCIEGQGVVKGDTADIHMKKGDTVIINARQLHTVCSDTQVKYRCLIIGNSFFKENGIDIENTHFVNSLSDNEAGKLMENIAKIHSDRSSLSVAEIRLAILSYIVYMYKNFAVTQKNEPKKISKSYAAVLSAVEYINENFYKKLSLEELSSKAGFSRYHFTRIFKENTGFTVIEHINAIRCDNAGFLLRETTKPISEISMECGFESPSYFAKAFADKFGILPSEYRKKYSKI